MRFNDLSKTVKFEKDGFIMAFTKIREDQTMSICGRFLCCDRRAFNFCVVQFRCNYCYSRRDAKCCAWHICCAYCCGRQAIWYCVKHYYRCCYCCCLDLKFQMRPRLFDHYTCGLFTLSYFFSRCVKLLYALVWQQETSRKDARHSLLLLCTSLLFAIAYFKGYQLPLAGYHFFIKPKITISAWEGHVMWWRFLEQLIFVKIFWTLQKCRK